MEDRQQLEQILETEFDHSYNVAKDDKHENDGNIDYVISSKNIPSKQIFLSYRDNAAMIFDVIKMDQLKRIKFPNNNDNEYIVYCGGPSDEANEDVANVAGIRYYKEYGELESNLKLILNEKIWSPEYQSKQGKIYSFWRR